MCMSSARPDASSTPWKRRVSVKAHEHESRDVLSRSCFTGHGPAVLVNWTWATLSVPALGYDSLKKLARLKV